MVPVQNYAIYLVEIAFKEDASYQELFALSVAFGVFWTIFFEISKPIVRRHVCGKPWFDKYVEREYERSKGLPGEMPKEEFFVELRKNWPNAIVMCSQHAAGAMLCVPALLGVGDASWASSLACLGLFSEIGFELYDLYVMRFLPLRISFLPCCTA